MRDTTALILLFVLLIIILVGVGYLIIVNAGWGMKAIVDLVELTFLMYLTDKTENIYQNEVKQAIKRLLLEEVMTITRDDMVN